MNSYKEAMEKAGAEVELFEEFGDYQGSWWAKVSYKGKAGWVNGSFGSCSGCDAFLGEFDYEGYKCEEHRYESDEKSSNCDDCKKKKSEYDERLAEFGKGYLDEILTKDEAIKKASENIEWDMDAQGMIDFITKN